MTESVRNPQDSQQPSDEGASGLSRRHFMAAAGAGAGAIALAGAVAGAGDAEAATTRLEPGAVPGAPGPQVKHGAALTSNLGVRISDDQNTLRAGTRGPSLLEDPFFREKMMHFDHERIPERVVHARGAGAHGVFELHTSLAQYTSAKVLTQVGARTEVFVRFSTVNGSRGSADTARDARGFATKFYTSEGIWDLVGNNIPVFFIQDAIKFPDLVHSFKPEPHIEVPQASTAHDTFYDFISLTPESAHMLMWVTSDRGIPRSFRMMEGFGIHTFRLVDASGRSTLVKFHWKPRLGVRSLVWDEAQKLGGVDPDFHRRDLAEAIDAGNFPKWDLGVQLLAENDVDKVTFDVLDATKLWPEEVVPVQLVGTMTLNRNPQNYFAETEQVAFCTSHVVPGIDFSDDPLLQGRNFSYFDTQLNRFNGPNWTQLPVNQPRSPVNNFQQDGFMRYANRPGRVNYEPNSLPGGTGHESSAAAGGYVSYAEPVSGTKIRARSSTFADHFSQATLFFQSMTEPEKQHIIQALQFELGHVTVKAVQERMLGLLANIDDRLVREVAGYLGLPVPSGSPNTRIGTAPSLSQERISKPDAATRKVGVLVAEGVSATDVAAISAALRRARVTPVVVGPRLGPIPASGGSVTATMTYLTSKSVQFDALFVAGGTASLTSNGAAVHFVEEAFMHYKAIGASGDGSAVPRAALGSLSREPGVVVAATAQAAAPSFVAAVAAHRHWSRTGVSRIS
ncbi:catalase [Motilibacter peucedani]|uniref:Catalase n=1 Tax=Motilibacter peucedani TaxID=598650 RepID=A0A420XT92_9ACTN|nr:catalase [Motilibacter peucedani]RKS80048.1 catalase [Motilibacter peucedani]